MIVAPLSSGSAGNAYWFESDGTAILVDAGIGPRDTKKRLESIGRDIEQLSAIVLTHEHSDHIHGAEKIARKYGIPIYLTRGTLDASSIDPDETSTYVFENNSHFTIGELQVHARRTIHDAADPACFVIEARDGTRVGIASDLGHVDEAVVGISAAATGCSSRPITTSTCSAPAPIRGRSSGGSCRASAISRTTNPSPPSSACSARS